MQRRAFEVSPRANVSRLLSELQVEIGGRLTRLNLPSIDGLTYQLVTKVDAPVTLAGQDFSIKPCGFLRGLLMRARARWLVKPKDRLVLDQMVIFARGPRGKRREFRKALQSFRNGGLALDRPELSQFPELLAGWADRPAAPSEASPHPRRPSPPRFAIVAHVYYPEVWPEFSTILHTVTEPFDLIITTVPDREALSARIVQDFPDADIRVFENRGRDVRPFLCLLEEGRLDRYAYVCKIHGKKSVDGGRVALLGNIWRNRLLFDLLAAPGVIDRILGIFDAFPRAGMVGSQSYRYPSDHFDLKASWGKNRETVLAIASRMGIPPELFKLDFFGGTMFWARPEALSPLRELRLSAAFAEEQGKLDGALEHAVERLFSTAAEAAGYRLASVDGLETATQSSLAPAPAEPIIRLV
ncbi:rhamnan synthesis F family protein [Ancylobacter sp. WKF20]|uniref:rhamnan synthesis F family protein n=1 Tax=Ancylobacter sp. WKF20 TaxID=3039801 RepID=UPI00243467BE|nr:rhamnan synthesis F family protein [Ancylobacter sp. WKF20]WGD28364.1 rhamnan synthesis F family protein [Ancylobacter sp. WKF20]